MFTVEIKEKALKQFITEGYEFKDEFDHHHTVIEGLTGKEKLISVTLDRFTNVLELLFDENHHKNESMTESEFDKKILTKNIIINNNDNIKSQY